MTHGTQRITIERNRQIELLKWSKEHDQHHTNGELASAALCYIDPKRNYLWPWPAMDDGETNKAKISHIHQRNEKHVSGRIKNLVKAGALIAAEIDRLVEVASSAAIAEVTR